MIDTIAHWFHVLAEPLYYINPIMMVFVSVLWLVLHNKMTKEVRRMYLRCYALERQIDHIVLVNNLDQTLILVKN